MRDTSWFAGYRWGVFCHYLTEPATTAEEWNRMIDGFDVQGLAAQLHSIRAPYFFITLGQGSGHYCVPNETYDRITGIRPSKCSRRDLVADLHAALRPLGIELMVYVPADGSAMDHEARKGLGLAEHWSDDPAFQWWPGPHWAKYRLPEFHRKWEEVCRDWSLRFGKTIRSWWVDGAYAAHLRYPENEPPNLRTLADALRAGNPDAILAFNPGVNTPVIHYSAHEDFTAGEISFALPECKGPFVAGASGHKDQYHVLSYLGEDWCKGKQPRFIDELVTAYTKDVILKGGVVTWDVPREQSGLISEPFLRQLKAISDGVNRR